MKTALKLLLFTLATSLAHRASALSFEQWKIENFSPQELLIAPNVHETGDFDNDGIPNLIEFATGTSPRTGNISAVSHSRDETGFRFSVPRDQDRKIFCELEFSNDLKKWVAGSNLGSIEARQTSFVLRDRSASQYQFRRIRFTLLVSTTADSDADGINDDYERQVFGGLGADSFGDDDGDGLLNIEEFKGLYSLDAVPPANPLDNTPPDPEFQLRFSTDANRADSDGDGASDLSELMSGQDPVFPAGASLPGFMVIDSLVRFLPNPSYIPQRDGGVHTTVGLATISSSGANGGYASIRGYWDPAADAVRLRCVLRVNSLSSELITLRLSEFPYVITSMGPLGGNELTLNFFSPCPVDIKTDTGFPVQEPELKCTLPLMNGEVRFSTSIPNITFPDSSIPLAGAKEYIFSTRYSIPTGYPPLGGSHLIFADPASILISAESPGILEFGRSSTALHMPSLLVAGRTNLASPDGAFRFSIKPVSSGITNINLFVVSGSRIASQKVPVTSIAVDFLNADLVPTSDLQIATLQPPLSLVGSGSSSTIDPEGSEDRFYVRIRGGAQFGSGQARIATASPGVADDATAIPLHIWGDDLISEAQILVADDEDDDHQISGVPDDITGDQSHVIALGGKVTIPQVSLTGIAYPATLQSRPLAFKTVTVKIVILRLEPGGVPVISQEQVQRIWKSVSDSYAQAGIKVIATILPPIDPPAGVDLTSMSGLRWTDGNTLTPAAKALVDGAGTFGDLTDIHVFYVNNLFNSRDAIEGVAFADFALPQSLKGYAYNIILPSRLEMSGFPYSVKNRTVVIAASHELGHLLMNTSHDMLPGIPDIVYPAWNIMSSPTIEAGILSSKRFTPEQSYIIINNAHVK